MTISTTTYLLRRLEHLSLLRDNLQRDMNRGDQLNVELTQRLIQIQSLIDDAYVQLNRVND